MVEKYLENIEIMLISVAIFHNQHISSTLNDTFSEYYRKIHAFKYDYFVFYSELRELLFH